MEIMQLHYFKCVAEHASFTRAAEALHITQSALSRSIAQLEGDIGLQLFERKRGGRLTLNQNGKFFLTHVIRILNSLENTVSAVKEMSGLERGMVSVAVSEAVFLKNVFYDFLLDHPDVRLNCRLQSDEQMRSCLDDGTLNFAVCKAPIIAPDLNWQPVYRDHMTVMLHAAHPLADRNRIWLHELCGERFIISNLGFDMESLCTRMCNLAGFDPYVVYEGAGEDLSGMLVSAGLGVMITPSSISHGVRNLNVDLINRDRVVTIPLADDFAESEIGIVMKAGQFQSAAALELYDRIIAFYAGLAQTPDQLP